VVQEVVSVGADVAVFTEYVEGVEHPIFEELLKGAGFRTVTRSTLRPGQNQVLIATKLAHHRGSVRAPQIHGAVPSNVLHVHVGGVNVIGFRMPAFDRRDLKLKRRTWDWLHRIAVSLHDSRAIIVGDMNTQRGDPTRQCGDCIDRLEATGWTYVVPTTGHSWKHNSGTERCIDAAFISPLLRAELARYSWDFVARNGVESLKVGIPDHALLVIDIADAPFAVEHVT
jgi:hypothetical protein